MKNLKKENVVHLWTVACSSSAIDNETNNVSLFNIIEEINFQLNANVGHAVSFSEKKTLPIMIELVSLWKRLTTEGDVISDVKIELLDQSNQKMQEVSYRLEFKPQHQRMRARVRINGVNVTGQGEYNFSVLLKEGESGDFKEVSRIPLVVKITAPADPRLLQR